MYLSRCHCFYVHRRKTIMLSIYIGSLFLAFMMVSASAFIEQPTTVIVALGTQATFRCRHEHTNIIIGWQVNGTSVGQLKNPNVIPRTIRDESGHLVNILTIVALTEYNLTEVQCVAITISQNTTTELTPVATLIIQEGLNDSTVTMAPDGIGNGFTEEPSSITVAVGAAATFRCRHDSAHTIDWNINGRSLGNFIPPNVTQKILSSPGGFIHTLSILALEHYNETRVECVAITFLDEMRINQRRQQTPSVVLLIQGPLTAIRNFVKINFSLMWDPPFTLDLTSTDPDIVYCVDVYNHSCANHRIHIISNCSIEDSIFPYNSPQEIGLLEYVVTPRSNVEGVINGTPSALKEEYFMFNASNLVAIISKTNRSQNDVMLSLKYCFASMKSENLQKTLHSYSIRLESVDSGRPATKNYVASSDQIGVNRLILQVNNSLQQGRIWNCVVTPTTCKAISLSDNTEISTHDIQNINVSTTSSSNSVTISSDFISGSQASGMFTVAYSLTEDSNIYYSISTRLEDQQRLVAELEGLPVSKYNISVFALMDGLPFIRAAAKSKSITVSKLKGVTATRPSSSIHDCLPTEDRASDDTNMCISCSLMDESVGTCVAVVHPKPTFLHNSMRGLQDISVTVLNKSTLDSTCGGCLDGVSLNEFDIVIFAYHNGAIVSGSHVFVRQQPPGDTDSGSLMWIFRIVLPSVCGVISVIFVAVLIIFVVIFKIAKQAQCDKRIRVKRCVAYEVTKVELEQNPSYEERKAFEQSIDMNRCTAYEFALPMKKNLAYEDTSIL